MKVRHITGYGVATLFAMSLMLAGCGNDETSTDKVEEGATNSNTTDDTMKDKDTVTKNAETDYGFTSLSIEADVDGDQDAIDISYDREKNGTEAEYQYKGENKRGDAAMTELDAKFKNLKVDADTSEKEVIAEVERVFAIQNASRLEVEIDFSDGTEKEYKK
ncbi:YusW family protein [uncultured Exiguobacterium sp.]|uniref:YusW family protein n=1 Tax=uncultured Exiguobacterium sp. TaxID=202669 RepID=UPI0025D360B7|nr:YusW family protein [uncultured Exiguobacterium sp.]